MAWGDGRACVPGIPQQTVDTLLWHLQGRLDGYSVIRVWEKVVLPVWLMRRARRGQTAEWGRVRQSEEGSEKKKKLWCNGEHLTMKLCGSLRKQQPFNYKPRIIHYKYAVVTLTETETDFCEWNYSLNFSSQLHFCICIWKKKREMTRTVEQPLGVNIQ